MHSAKTLYGVLIADVVASRSTTRLRSLLGGKLRITGNEQLGRLIRVPYAVTAGDEFQVIALQLERIPTLIFDLRRRLFPLRLRIGIGIGRVEGQIRRPVNRISGEAFENARMAITETKTKYKYPRLTSFHSNDEEFDRMANLIYGLHDTLARRTTSKQWETIAVYWNKNRVDQTAKAMKLDRSTVSRNLSRGYFWQMKDSIAVMEEFIREQFK